MCGGRGMALLALCACVAGSALTARADDKQGAVPVQEAVPGVPTLFFGTGVNSNAGLVGTILLTDNKDARRPAAAKAAAKEAAAAKPELPPVFLELKLTPEQTEKIQQALTSHDSEIDKTWEAFQQSVAASIGLEAMLLVAIEDGLSEAQRTHVRKQRTNLHKKPAADIPAKGAAKADGDDAKPAEADEELVVIGIALSPEQRLQADKVHDSYTEQLEHWRERVRTLHARLVALEADKVVSIEHVLTKEQLTRLRELRKQPPAPPADAGVPANSDVKADK